MFHWMALGLSILEHKYVTMFSLRFVVRDVKHFSEFNLCIQRGYFVSNKIYCLTF